MFLGPHLVCQNHNNDSVATQLKSSFHIRPSLSVLGLFLLAHSVINALPWHTDTGEQLSCFGEPTKTNHLSNRVAYDLVSILFYEPSGSNCRLIAVENVKTYRWSSEENSHSSVGG